MRLQDFMSTDVATIAATSTATDAYELMRGKSIHHLVVRDGHAVIGVVSERDLGGTRGTALRTGRIVRDVMTTSVVIAAPEETVRQAANKMRGRGIGCLPVLDDEKVVGIVTVSDLLDLIGRGAQRPVRREGRRAVRSSPRGRSAGARA